MIVLILETFCSFISTCICMCNGLQYFTQVGCVGVARYWIGLIVDGALEHNLKHEVRE